MRRHIHPVAVGLVVALATISPLWSENLLANGEFDFDTLSWMGVGPSPPPGWDIIDHDACGAASGSALIENTAGEDNTTVAVRSCVTGILAGSRYSLDGFLRFPPDTVGSGAAWMTVLWYGSPDCTEDYFGSYGTALLTTSNPGTWFQASLLNMLAPAGAASAEVRLNLNKAAALGVLEANFDGVHLVLGSGYLFGDDFESDTTCRWSMEAP